jgi:assimilatory nitrate reductase catalytic subunit
VSEARIADALLRIDGSEAERLRALQQLLRCGTECGSCIPAVKALMQRNPVALPMSGSAA